MRTMFVWRSATRLPTVIDERGEHPEDRLPRVLRREEPEQMIDEQRDEAAGLRRDRQERGDRRGRAFVGVGRPEVERHRARS